MARHVGRTTFAARVNIPFCIAAVLLCLTLISMHLSSGLFARYSTSVADDDSARVAKFEVTNETLYDGLAISATMPIEISPSMVKKYAVEINNASEVAVKCTISPVNKTGNIESLTFSAPAAVEITPGGSATCDMTVNFPATNAEQYMGMVDLIELTVLAEQID